MKIPKSLKILGKVWSLEYPAKRLPPDRWGDCDGPETPNKKIRIHKDVDITTQRFLTLLLHECSHAAFWEKDEKTINRFSKDISTILWNMGFRINDED